MKSEHKHSLVYKNNFSIDAPIKMKCTVCGKELVLCGGCKELTDKPIYSCWDDGKEFPRCKDCMSSNYVHG